MRASFAGRPIPPARAQMSDAKEERSREQSFAADVPK